MVVGIIKSMQFGTAMCLNYGCSYVPVLVFLQQIKVVSKYTRIETSIRNSSLPCRWTENGFLGHLLYLSYVVFGVSRL